MNFASRITRLPHPFEPDRGTETRALFPGVDPGIQDVIEGAGGCSPYLKGLCEKEQDWLAPAFDGPEAAIEALFVELRQVPPDQLASALRRGKRRVALLAGLADLGGVWSLEEVTGTLTRFADLATHLAIRACVGHELRRGKIPGKTEADAETGAGMVALAMGKMGAGELNYSSDIDLICLFDESQFERDDYHEARAALIRATRKMAAMLNDQTGEGYVFRTDLRLRPDPSVTPVCMTMEAAERYYESLGRTWERAAYIKARACAGDIVAGEKFLQTLRPFVWRRHLDFAAIQDAHDMRLRIRAHKGLGGPITLPGHNMKLGRGGIREIEFFTQTQQIIAGGRDPDLRVRGTVGGLAVLAQKDWLPTELAEGLTGHYRFHREVEHRLQMVADAQTQTLPNSDEGFDRIAAMMGTDRAALKADLMSRLTEVHESTEGFFAPDADPGAETETGDDADTETSFDSGVTSRWRSYAALRSPRAVEIFNRIRPEILRRLAETARPDEALNAFDGFLSGLPAGVQLFSLFEANPQLIDLLVDIAGTSPALARYLSRNSSVFDAVIGGDFFSDWPGEAGLTAELAQVLAREGDYERKLDAARRWAKEWHFRIGVHHLRGLIDAAQAGAQYADLASANLAALWPEVVAHFAGKHGLPPGRGAVVLGMGSLGAARLTSASDLDLIVIYDAQGIETSEGRRPLAARTYYARLTQALVTAMTAPMAEGRLYEVDMRLRPSGTQGPVATSWQSFESYQKLEAWVWEHLALTRARAVAGAEALGQDVETLRCALLGARPRDEVLQEVAKMRARIAAAKSPDGPLDAKIGPGRMQDIELLAQAGALIDGCAARSTDEGLAAAARAGVISEAEMAALAEGYALQGSLQMASRLLSDRPLDPEALSGGGAGFVLRECAAETLDDLIGRLAEVRERADAAITGALPAVEEKT
ncbi:bifunctional [glutamine synthetase] adenylyltransferase/[glutamine synthetase]-adenylyl-L-tyrosine phosphorylase [Marinovum sp.]|uniref:bifunctional [glutamine synthetase] adenylyltransferase/[glutamine synthetase]-adenylyl-L-tyrosine phosphorylase n=1 Tax=Marinovum sp. TaxID=2024839 RepID=UPI003A900F3D